MPRSVPLLSSIPHQRKIRHTVSTHQTRQIRRYASSMSPSSNHQDVPSWPRQPHPTPYEIFDISHSAPYTKHRFYQLVKLYHPDTGSNYQAESAPPTPASNIPDKTRLERYRLVIAANDLLSDPNKRSLYDKHGIGWSADGPSAPATARERDTAWRHQPNSPVRNATWEDWEAWRESQKDGGGHTEPVYMSNGLFAVSVITVCFIGCMIHMNRAESIGQEYVQYSAQRNADIGNTVRMNTMASAGRSRDDRIEGFLRERENTAYSYAPRKYDPQARGQAVAQEET